MKNDAVGADELLQQARRGDREALGRLLEVQRAALHRLAERQLAGRVAVRVDASDIIQQTFLEAHRSFQQFAGRDVRREQSMDDSQGGKGPLKQQLDAGLSSPSEKAIRGEEERRLAEALTTLPADQREAVRLRHLEGWALADIARRLGRSPAATAGLIKRGMQALRRRLHGRE